MKCIPKIARTALFAAFLLSMINVSHGEQKTAPQSGNAAVQMPKERPNVVKGLEISVEADGKGVMVAPGVCKVGGKEVTVATATTVSIDDAETSNVVAEPYQLSDIPCNRWLGGTHLAGAVAGGTALPGCLVPNSVQVTAQDGTAFERGKDFEVDDAWACVHRKPKGQITTEAVSLVSYGAGLLRVDSVVVQEDGNVSVIKGPSRNTVPRLATIPGNCTVIANVFVPYQSKRVEAWQVFPIGAPFQEPDKAEQQRRSGFVKRTLERLRAGKDVTIVMWGDSVTDGRDVTPVTAAYANKFPETLRKRFPQAKINAVNAGIGATNTDGRLPAFDKEVLSFKPDLVTIEFVNDMSYDREHLLRNYKEALDKITSAGAEAILITPHFTMAEWMGHPHPRGKETRAAVSVLREIADKHNIGLADTSRRWEHLEEEGISYLIYLENGINHPDDRGHELFVRDLMTFFPEI